MSVDLSQFHQVFFEESFENLDAMEEHLMAIDPSNLDSETINSIFRAAHSIKGGSGTFGFTDVSEFTHLLETLLDELRSGSRSTSQDEIDLYLQAVDCLRDMLQACQQGETIDTARTQEITNSFKQLLDISGGSEEASAGETEELEEEDGTSAWKIKFQPQAELLVSGNEPLRMFRVLAESGDFTSQCDFSNLPSFGELTPEHCYLNWQLAVSGEVERSEVDEVFEWVLDLAELSVEKTTVGGSTPGWIIDFAPGKETIQTGNDPLRILRDLAEMGPISITANIPDFKEFQNYQPEECQLSWHVEMDTTNPEEDIRKAFEWVEDESDIEIKAKSVKPAKAKAAAEAKPAQAASPAEKAPAAPANADAPAASKKAPAKAESSTIRVAIDKIDSLINMVGELVITQSMLGQIGGDFSMDKLARLREGLGQLEHNTRELQESVMRIRMLPISFAFSRFPRMVRDLSRRLDKQIELVLKGEQTELDKTVMERIGDPLVHLVRNALDHGIESTEDRLAAGKDATGTITLNAYHQSGNVVIEIQDDGRGINKDKLTDKAKSQGLLTQSDIQNMSDGQIFDLIFHPGLSTAAEVSDVSGRGVGMDVVKRNIQELNGSVDITSQENVGTTITIRLPLTLAILDGQLVRVGSHIYIFPLVSIVESMQVKEDQLNKVAAGCEVFQLRQEYIPVVRLYEIFNVKPDSTQIEDSLLVVVEADGEKIGIVVDELSSQQQVVIKSLEQNYQRIEGVSGATILGDGTVSLILDIPGIVKIAGVNQMMSQNIVSNNYQHIAQQAVN